MSSGINPTRGLAIILNLFLAEKQNKYYCYLLLFDETIGSKRKLAFKHVLELPKGHLRRLVPLNIQQNGRKDSRTYTKFIILVHYKDSLLSHTAQTHNNLFEMAKHRLWPKQTAAVQPQPDS